ncbi:MAG: hypothetical protein KDA53_12685 [Hyphomonas sp.]|nr:hypothetical protein [Hyphomonas sp.]
MANDLAALKALIANNIERSDLDDEIAAAITVSIEFYADRPFWFLEEDGTVDTVADQAYVNVPDGLRVHDEEGVEILVNGSTYELGVMTWREYRRHQRVASSSGQPYGYTYRNGQFFLHPTPDDAYTVTVFGIYDADALTADSSVNVWTDAGRDLIAGDVAMRLGRDVMRDSEIETKGMRKLEIALAELTRKTTRRKRTGKVRGHL